MRFYVQDFGDDIKLVHDSNEEMKTQQFDNCEEAQEFCDFLNLQEIRKIEADRRYNNLKYKLQKIIEVF